MTRKHLINQRVRLDILSCIGAHDPKEAGLEVRLLRGDLPWSLTGVSSRVRDIWVDRRDRLIRTINKVIERHGLTAGLFHLGESRRGGNRIELVIFRGEEEEIWQW